MSIHKEVDAGNLLENESLNLKAIAILISLVLVENAICLVSELIVRPKISNHDQLLTNHCI